MRGVGVEPNFSVLDMESDMAGHEVAGISMMWMADLDRSDFCRDPSFFVIGSCVGIGEIRMWMGDMERKDAGLIRKLLAFFFLRDRRFFSFCVGDLEAGENGCRADSKWLS